MNIVKPMLGMMVLTTSGSDVNTQKLNCHERLQSVIKRLDGDESQGKITVYRDTFRLATDDSDKLYVTTFRIKNRENTIYQLLSRNEMPFALLLTTNTMTDVVIVDDCQEFTRFCLKSLEKLTGFSNKFIKPTLENALSALRSQKVQIVATEDLIPIFILQEKLMYCMLYAPSLFLGPSIIGMVACNVWNATKPLLKFSFLTLTTLATVGYLMQHH